VSDSPLLMGVWGVFPTVPADRAKPRYYEREGCLYVVDDRAARAILRAPMALEERRERTRRARERRREARASLLATTLPADGMPGGPVVDGPAEVGTAGGTGLASGA
jgi:hypothetical protein